MFLGYLYAFIGSLFFAAYVVPRKFSKLPPASYVMFVGLSFFSCWAIYYPLSGAEFKVSPALVLSAFCGALWTLTFACLTVAVDRLGISRVSPWRSMQTPIGVILSLVILSEHQVASVYIAIIAAAGMFASALLLNTKKDNQKKYDLIGIYFAAATGVLFGVVGLIVRYVAIHVEEIALQQIYFSGAMFVSAFIYMFIKERGAAAREAIADGAWIWPVLAGALIGLAYVFQILAVKILPNAIVLTMLQLAAVWTILAGVFWFKEIDMRTHRRRVWLGLIFAGASIAILLLAMK
ncbi:MAG: GRP family sugar transporter [Alphaproteobacteria bacterium]|nr:GRP family sugar transporter [Alphaproteobacteria bacterium]